MSRDNSNNLNNYDENGENEKNIIEQDKIKREILIEDDRYYEEDIYNGELKEKEKEEEDINLALNLSINEFNKQNELNNKFEEELINNYQNLWNERKEIFQPLLLELIRLSNYDKEIKEIYEILEPIIESYCKQYFEILELDQIIFDKIFKVLSSIRINKNIIDILKTVIIKHLL